MLLYNTGLRVSELCGLNRDDVLLPEEGWGMLQVVGKGRRLRRLPINRPAADALLAYLADRDDAEPALFLNRSGERFSVRGIAFLVNRYLRGGRDHRSLRPAPAAPHLRHPCPPRPAESTGGAGVAGPCLGDHHPALHAPGDGGLGGPGRQPAWERHGHGWGGG